MVAFGDPEWRLCARVANRRLHVEIAAVGSALEFASNW